MKQLNLDQSAKILNDYLTDGNTHTIAEIIVKAREINPNIPAHIIGGEKPDSIKVELYCKREVRSVIVPYDKEYVTTVTTVETESLWKRFVRWIKKALTAEK